MSTTRDTYALNLGKNYKKVVHQQATPAVDADFNEAQDIGLDNARQIVSELLLDNGRAESTGFPRGGLAHCGFRPIAYPTAPDNNFRLSAGTIWRRGERYVLEGDAVLYGSQLDDAGSPVTPLTTPSGADRTDLVYLEVLTVDIDSGDDADLINSAIAIETATREQKFAVVKVLEGSDTSIPLTPNLGVNREAYALAAIYRTDGVDAITQDMIVQIPSEVWVSLGGDDANQGSSSNTPVATIQEALRRVPKILNEDWRIRISPGTYAEPLRVSDLISMPRHSATTIYGPGDTFITFDGRPRDRYELVIDAVGWDQLPSINICHINGSTWDSTGVANGQSEIRGCSNVTVRGLYFENSPASGLRVVNSDNIQLAQCVFIANSGSGLNITNSTVSSWGIISQANFSHGVTLNRASAFTLWGTCIISSNVIHGILAQSSSSLNLRSDDPYGVTHSEGSTQRRIYDNGGSQIQVSLSSNCNCASGLQVYQIYQLDNDAGHRGVTALQGSLVDLNGVEFGRENLTSAHTNTAGCVLAQDGSRVRLTDCVFDGSASLAGAPATDSNTNDIRAIIADNATVIMDGVTVRDYSGACVSAINGAFVGFQHNLGATTPQTYLGFANANSNANPRVMCVASRLEFSGNFDASDQSQLNGNYTEIDGSGSDVGLWVTSRSSVLVNTVSRLWVHDSDANQVAEVNTGSCWLGGEDVRSNGSWGTAGGAHIDNDFDTGGAQRSLLTAGGQSDDPHQCVITDTSAGTGL
jgi:hypothetical protein